MSSSGSAACLFSDTSNSLGEKLCHTFYQFDILYVVPTEYGTQKNLHPIYSSTSQQPIFLLSRSRICLYSTKVIGLSPRQRVNDLDDELIVIERGEEIVTAVRTLVSSLRTRLSERHEQRSNRGHCSLLVFSPPSFVTWV